MSIEWQAMNYLIVRMLRLLNILEIKSDLAVDIVKTIMLLSGFGFMSKNSSAWFLHHYKNIQSSYNKENINYIAE